MGDEMREVFASCEVPGPANEEMIARAEAELGVSFPPSYRSFLASYGAAVCAGFWIAGLFETDSDEEPPFWSHVVTSTMQLRRSARRLISQSYVAISDDGGDHKFYLDTGRTDGHGECPVVVLGPGAPGVDVADDFLEFVTLYSRDKHTF